MLARQNIHRQYISEYKMLRTDLREGHRWYVQYKIFGWKCNTKVLHWSEKTGSIYARAEQFRGFITLPDNFRLCLKRMGIDHEILLLQALKFLILSCCFLKVLHSAKHSKSFEGGIFTLPFLLRKIYFVWYVQLWSINFSSSKFYKGVIYSEKKSHRRDGTRPTVPFWIVPYFLRLNGVCSLFILLKLPIPHIPFHTITHVTGGRSVSKIYLEATFHQL